VKQGKAGVKNVRSSVQRVRGNGKQLQSGFAVAVHDALGQAGCSRRIKDEAHVVFIIGHIRFPGRLFISIGQVQQAVRQTGGTRRYGAVDNYRLLPFEPVRYFIVRVEKFFVDHDEFRVAVVQDIEQTVAA
jgi:hypothetical protein